MNSLRLLLSTALFLTTTLISSAAFCGDCTPSVWLVNMSTEDSEEASRCFSSFAVTARELYRRDEGEPHPVSLERILARSRYRDDSGNFMSWTEDPISRGTTWEERSRDYQRLGGSVYGSHVVFLDCNPANQSVRLHHFSSKDNRWISRASFRSRSVGGRDWRRYFAYLPTFQCDP